MPTTTRATFENWNPAEGWEGIRFQMAKQGDDTAPEMSARLLDAKIYPDHQHHGVLCGK